MSSLAHLEEEVMALKKRNARVESDKAWETSAMRKCILMICTYLAIGIYMRAIAIANPWTNAVIPTIGFFLSTLTLPLFRKFWEKYLYQK